MTDDTDTRVTCTGCANRQRGRFGLAVCTTPKQAGLIVPRSTEQLELGRDFATLPQHCPAHKPQQGAKA